MSKVYADVVEIPEGITTLLGDGAALNSFRLRDYDAIGKLLWGKHMHYSLISNCKMVLTGVGSIAYLFLPLFSIGYFNMKFKYSGRPLRPSRLPKAGN